jgi:hypothetical protein
VAAERVPMERPTLSHMGRRLRERAFAAEGETGVCPDCIRRVDIHDTRVWSA